MGYQRLVMYSPLRGGQWGRHRCGFALPTGRGCRGGELSLGGVNAGPHHGPHHVVEKSVCTNPAGDEVSLPGDLKIMYRADGGLGLGPHGTDAGKVMGSHKVLGRLVHHGLVQLFGIEPHPVDQKALRIREL